jgi:hypothetical protein
MIDARGKLVTPGFVDVHTHYDGQATWDDRLEPSASHGVTTVIAGNCGVGFAPVRPGGQAELVELMEGVEDIPGIALYEGIEWSWETFPQYPTCSIKPGRWMSARTCRGARVRDGERGAGQASTGAGHRADGRDRAMQFRPARWDFPRRASGHQSIKGLPVPGTFAGEGEVFAIGEGWPRPARYSNWCRAVRSARAVCGSVQTRRVSTTNSNGWRACRRRHACRSRS